MILDNHSAHKGKRIAMLKEFCTPKFVPPYSHELNMPIERVWSVIKARAKRQMTAI